LIILLHFYSNFKEIKRSGKIHISALVFILFGLKTIAYSREDSTINIANKCSIIFDIDTTYCNNPIKNYDSIQWKAHPFKLFGIQSQQYKNEFVIKYEFTHLSNASKTLFLEVDNTLIDKIYFYHYAENKLLKTDESGDEIPFINRKTPFRNPLFEIVVNEKGKHIILLKIISDGRRLNFPLRLIEANSFVLHAEKKDLLFGFYLGVLFLLCFLSVYFGLIVRDSVFYFYALYIFFLSINQAILSGIAFQYFWPNQGEWSNKSGPITIILTIIFGLIFAKSFFKNEVYNKYVIRSLNVFLILNMLLLTMMLQNGEVFNVSIRIMYNFIVIFYISLCILGVYYLFKKVQITRFYILGFLLATAIISFMTFLTNNKEPEFIFTNNLVVFLLLFKCIVLFLALIDRFRIYKNEKELAQLQLIQKLEEINSLKENLNEELAIQIEIKTRELEKKQTELYWSILTGEERERKRIAKELHDGLGAQLSAIKLHAQSVDYEKMLLVENTKTLHQNLINQIDEACLEVRSISHDLLPPGLINSGIIESINRFVHQIKENSDIDLKFIHQIEKETFTKDVEVQIFRIIQELVNNILKHAHAQSAAIQLIQDNSRLLIIAEDDGIGFDIEENNNGLGINNIRNRIASLKGSIVFDTLRNNGTTVIIEITLPE
jgi:signal transduction histidine kinase